MSGGNLTQRRGCCDCNGEFLQFLSLDTSSADNPSVDLFVCTVVTQVYYEIKVSLDTYFMNYLNFSRDNFMLPANYYSEILTAARALINCFIREIAFGNDVI